jgi:hypothetical protein
MGAVSSFCQNDQHRARGPFFEIFLKGRICENHFRKGSKKEKSGWEWASGVQELRLRRRRLTMLMVD